MSREYGGKLPPRPTLYDPALAARVTATGRQVLDQLKEWITPEPTRQCIACGAKVAAGRSEVCPHE